MDKPNSTNKRKKKRTRKCLDEIRKRSRNVAALDVHNDIKLGKHFPNPSKTSMCNNNSCITSKRLTLRPTVFSKSVKSETVTRPVAVNQTVNGKNDGLKSSSRHVNNSRACEKSRIISPNKNQNLDSSNANGYFANNPGGNEGIYFQVDSDSDIGAQNAIRNTTSKSQILFSPISQVLRNNIRLEKNQNNATPSPLPAAPEATSSEAIGSRGSSGGVGSRYRLYSELMRELPARLQRRTPKLTGGGAYIIKKIKAALKKNFVENSSDSEVEINSEECSSSSERLAMDGSPLSAASVIQNPSEYVRRNTEPSPSPTPSPPPALAYVIDTPEYNYYPRKLNP